MYFSLSLEGGTQHRASYRSGAGLVPVEWGLSFLSWWKVGILEALFFLVGSLWTPVRGHDERERGVEMCKFLPSQGNGPSVLGNYSGVPVSLLPNLSNICPIFLTSPSPLPGLASAPLPPSSPSGALTKTPFCWIQFPLTWFSPVSGMLSSPPS